MSFAIMHMDLHNRIRTVSFGDVETLRQRLGISKSRLCQLAGVNPTTYSRWVRQLRGRPDGNNPQPRSLMAVHDVLKAVKEASEAEAENTDQALPLAGKPDRAA